MTFEEILDQAIAMLQRRRRVTYRALKLQLHLDDEQLDALKEELLYAHPGAVEEEGQGLVWTEGMRAAPNLPPPHLPEAAERQEVSPVLPTRRRARGAEAERRQLTVLFCDLEDYTPLSEALDPEELREVVRAYQEMCAAAIARFDGHIAKYLGDGLLIYFGYPLAHEDDAQRAVRAGLEILSELPPLNARLQEAVGARRQLSLQARIGIHTGLVVAGEMGGGEYREQMAIVGETPNIAARMQEIAPPNTVVMSAATHRLTQGFFELLDLGSHTLKGVSTPVQLYQPLRESGVRSRLEIAVPGGLTPLVGREQELGHLRERWEQVRGGTGQVVLLRGEAGIGKSRLVRALKEQIAPEPHTRLECQCSPYLEHSALYPLIDLWQRVFEWRSGDSPPEKLGKLEGTLARYGVPLSEVVPLWASLLSLPFPEARYPPLTLAPERQRQRTLEAVLSLLREISAPQPLLFVMEDLHWADPSTLEFLSLLMDREPPARMLTLLVFRPNFNPPWDRRSHLTEMTLNQLPPEAAETIVTRVAGGKALPPEVLQQLVMRTDGIPLFVEELTRMVLESGLLRAENGKYELTGSLPPLAIPTTLHDSLMARLDRLGVAKEIAQLGAVLGREFSYSLLRAVAPVEEAVLRRGLGRLAEAELLYQRGEAPQATYTFKHALVQDAAYQSLLKSRRQQVHQHVAHLLETRFPETVETQPELLAHHYTEAGLNEQAVGYWQRAGERANERGANVEAIRHLTRGLELLQMLPETPERLQRELTLQTVLGRALRDARGYGYRAAEQAYTRARELCRQIGETPQLFPALLGLSIYSVVRGELQTARELGAQLLSLAQRAQDPVLLVEAYYSLGVTCSWLGEFASAREYLVQGIAHYDPERHRAHLAVFGQDGGAVCLCRVALVLWYLGYPDQALARSHEAVILARELSHPLSLAYVLTWTGVLYHHRREVEKTQEWADTVTALSSERGFPYWSALGTILQGWALAAQGKGAEGMAQIRKGLVALRATGTEVFRPYCLGLLAGEYGKMGQVREGLALLDEALALVNKTGERWPEAELHRLKGELLLSARNHTAAEGCLHLALDVARRQHATSLELRAAMSLSRLWQQQDKQAEAYQLLAEVYGWFTEGFDTADLQEAKALLDALA